MLRIYDFAIRLTYGLFSILAIASSKYRLFLKTKSYTDTLPSKQTKRILIHCASLGEFEIARSVASSLKKSGYELIISFFSPSGFDNIRVDKELLDYKVYLPKDTKREMLAFFLDVQPDYVLITKSEFWPNMLHILTSLSIPFAFLAIELDYPNSRYFRFPLRQLLKAMIKADHFFTQTDNTKKELIRQGIQTSKITTIGNPRILGIIQDQPVNILENVVNKPTVIFGSVYCNDIPMIQEVIMEYPNYRFLIFPHHLDPKTKIQFKHSFPSFTEYTDDFNASNMLILKIGILKNCYSLAEIAYVGGGFQKGVHNTLEAILNDCPVIIGPKNKGFPEVQHFSNTPYLYIIQKRRALKSALHNVMQSNQKSDILEAYIAQSLESRNRVKSVIENKIGY